MKARPLLATRLCSRIGFIRGAAIHFWRVQKSH